MVAFINTALEYIILMVILAVIMFVGGFIGLKLRNAKDAKKAVAEAAGDSREEE